MVKEILYYWTFFTLLGNLGGLVLTTILDAYPMIVFSNAMTGMLILILYHTRKNFLLPQYCPQTTQLRTLHRRFMRDDMRTALIITTYNRPGALGLILDSVARQSIRPDEVIVADDGSDDKTALVIAAKKTEHGLPLVHMWQEDKGFRAARVRNLGVSTATADYLIFIDGDILLHREFVRSHLEHCKAGRLLYGSRVLITDARARRVVEGHEPVRFHMFQPGLRNRLNAIHSILLSRLFSKRQNKWKSRGCNLSLFRRDFVAVNGYNEDFVGWGYEDSEFVLRLMRNGVEKFKLRCCAVGYHLGHSWSNERMYEKEIRENLSRLRKVADSEIVRCAHGFDEHVVAIALDQRTSQQ